jgi:2-polyprenyl-3-methyl-5-hydroxy-6-metoxy-1,4-benzoquinol methylase
MPCQETGLLSGWLRARRIQAAKKFISGKTLDFGCGIGSLAAFIPADLYLGVELDNESLSIAREKYSHHNFRQQIPRAGKFDCIAMLAVIEHLKDPQDYLSKLKSLLHQEGKIIITTPHPRAKLIHYWGAKWGLFSKEACGEHECWLNKTALEELISPMNLRLDYYRKFLIGFNQLFILKNP